MAVGFGVSTAEHVKQVNHNWHLQDVGLFPTRCSSSDTLIDPLSVIQIAGWGADGVIVGSAMVRLLGEAASPEEGLKKLEELAKELKAALA